MFFAYYFLLGLLRRKKSDNNYCLFFLCVVKLRYDIFENETIPDYERKGMNRSKRWK